MPRQRCVHDRGDRDEAQLFEIGGSRPPRPPVTRIRTIRFNPSPVHKTGDGVFRPHWDLYAASIILLFAFYQAMQWPLLPKFVDIYYHLAVVKGFSDAGGWVARDTWEFAPSGTPHLYPPFLHLWLLIPYRLGVDPISIGRAVDVLSYPALLASFWFFVRARGGSRAAFWATLLFSTVYSAFLASVTLSAFNLAMVGAVWALYFLSSARPAAAALAAGAVAYTHTMAAGILAVAFVLAACMDRQVRANAVKALAAAVLLSLPILSWQGSHHGAFRLIPTGEARSVEIDLFLYGLAVLRVARSVRRRAPDVWPLALFLAMAPLIPLRQARILGGYGVLCAAWLAALEIISWVDSLSRGRGKKAGVLLGAALALFFAFFAPTLHSDLERGSHRLRWADRSLVRYLVPDASRDFRAKGFSIYFEEEYREIEAVIQGRLRPDEVFWTDFPHAGGILYLKTGRAMSTSMLGEVGDWKDREARLKAAKLLIWFKTGEGKAPDELASVVRKMGLKPVAETQLSLLFENPSGGAASLYPTHLISTSYMFSILALWLAALVYFSRPRLIK